MPELPAPNAATPDLALRARKCTICQHPQREEIEEEYAYWGHPGTIVRRFGLSHRSILYRHARATRLNEVRAYNLRTALSHIIERSAITKPSANDIVHAVRAYAHLNGKGKWEEPVRKIMAVKPETEAKQIQFVVSENFYDIIQQQRRNDQERYQALQNQNANQHPNPDPDPQATAEGGA